MAKINEIFNNFREETIKNSFIGKEITGAKINWKNEPILLNAIKIESNQILFNYNNDVLRILITNKNFRDDDDNNRLSQSLFWITGLKGVEIEITYLPCGKKQLFESLDIGYGDNIISEYKSIKIEKLSECLYKDFVFESGETKIIFVQTYPNREENSFTIHGLKKRADIVLQNRKLIIKKIINKPFTKRHDDFLLLNVNQYSSIKFVEASKAKKAYEIIKAEESKGKTLIALWKTYSDIELERAIQLKEKFRELSFLKKGSLPEGITQVRINNMTEEIKALIIEHRDDLLGISFELMKEKEIRTSNKEQDNDRDKKGEIYLIKSINDDFTFELYDKLYTIPNKGKFTISLRGNEIVKKRRERAKNDLENNRRFIIQNLLFAIEGSTDAMINKQRNEKPLTERTRKFLKDKFGIEDLTQNQKEAVNIAINTPDLAIIQGPPGTGKSTIIAAICDRLIEIAEKKKKDLDRKLILVSAFQNDTVEHIASKIYTFGLPTIKVGKETESVIRAENKFIEDIKSHINKSLEKLSPKVTTYRLSKKLLEIKSIYLSEKDEKKLKQDIDNLLINSEISDELWDEWEKMKIDIELIETSIKKNFSLLRDLRTERELYNKDGFYRVQKLLTSDIPFTETEKKFLENCPVDNPDESTLIRIKEIQEIYFKQLNDSIYSNSSRYNQAILEWIDKAIHYFKQKEESLYKDEETFLAANLEALKDELDGSTAYIRDTIKDYCESLAATNQLSGGREISEYNFENVILEEAARSNPLDLLIPLTRAIERIIMVGDQNQLPHLLEDDIADETSLRFIDRYSFTETKKKLEESLFSVIFKNLQSAKPRRTITLTEQFRMHPFLGDFISKVYYNNQIKTGMPNQAELKKHGLEIPWAKDRVAIFCDVKKSEGPEQPGKSKSRPSEAKRIIKLLDELNTDKNFENLTVGIITFYAKQVYEIFRAAAKKGFVELKSNGNYEITSPYLKTQDGREKLRIGTVDSFQGKEFDIVILSTVRSNTIKRTHDNYKKVFGFLTLENRLNVAFSRAKKLLIVVGDGEMFSDDFAKTYVEGLYEFYTNLSTDSTYGNRI